MHAISKRDYLIQVKNAMLFHFDNKDICNTLKDINELFVTGIEHGKSEEEICYELGSPKDFVIKLVEDSSYDRLSFKLFTYIIGILGICILTMYIFHSLNPIYWCALAIAVSIYIWKICGGSCLNGFFTNLSHHKIEYVVYYLISVAIVTIQQIFTFQLNKLYDEMVLYIHISYYLSILVVLILGLFLLFIIYKLSHGSYLSLCILPLLVGIICSFLCFITYISLFNGPDVFSSICSLPYIIGNILSLFLFLNNNYLRGF